MDQAKKKARKQVRFDDVPVEEKGKTLHEIEEEEGGTIKEALVGMAQTKRALSRKTKDAGQDDEETDIVPATEVERYEEQLTIEEEEGIKFEPFNLKEEREVGHFDDDGNYVIRKDAEATDAWLESEEAKVVSEKVKKMLADREKAAAASYQGPLTDRSMAQMKSEIAGKLRPGETLLKALKRLGGNAPSFHKAMGKRERARLAQQAKTVEQPPDAESINRLTELADKLLDEGELDVYSCTKEEFEHAAALFLPKTEAATEKTDGDMFGDDDDDMFSEKIPVPVSAAQPPAMASGEACGSVHSKPYSAWTIPELKMFLTERGSDTSSILEKGELVKKVEEIATGWAAIPEGYEFDPTTTYYFNANTNLYYDPNTCGYCDASTNKWYVYDSDKQQLVEWNATAGVGT